MFPAKPEPIGERELRHPDELVVDAQAVCTIIADMSDRVFVAYTCTRVMQNRLCSTDWSYGGRLFSTALGALATVRGHWHTSGVEQPGHTFVSRMQDRRSVEVLRRNQRKQFTVMFCIEELVDEVFVAKTKVTLTREQLRTHQLGARDAL